MQDELVRFVESLAVPTERKTIVLAELSDHLACAIEAARREGRDPDAAARAALGDLEALRQSLETIEPAFRITRWRALARGLVAGLLVGFVIDQVFMQNVVGAVVAVAIAAAFMPPRTLQLLRAELRSPNVPGTFARGVKIGPAVTYLYTVLSVPFVVWIGLIVGRALTGNIAADTPWAAFAVPVIVNTVLLVEGLRAHRAKAAA